MATVTILYGTKTNLTITLNSLAASATVGRQSTVVDNTSTKALDANVQGVISCGATSGNERILFYIAGSFDGGTTYSLTNGANVIGASDAGFTRVEPSSKLPAYILPVPTDSVVYSYDFSVAQCFGGNMPDHWALVVFNDSGATLAASANTAWYKEINATVA